MIVNLNLLATNGNATSHNVENKRDHTTFSKPIQGNPRTIHLWEAKTERGKLLQGCQIKNEKHRKICDLGSTSKAPTVIYMKPDEILIGIKARRDTETGFLYDVKF